MPTRRSTYLRPGGPWDIAPLDHSLGFQEVVDDRGRLSAAQLEERVARTAGGLWERGVRPGDAVAWQLRNSIDALVLYRACWRLHAVAVPVHHQAGATEVDRLLTTIEPRVVIDRVPEGSALSRRPPKPAALAVALPTAGSTGEPKVVLHGHRGLLYKARLMCRVHGLTPADAVLMPAPLAHVSGLLNAVLVPGAVPMKTVLMARWDPEAALQLIERERITFMVGPPTFFLGLLAAPGFAPRRVASLRLVSSGGAGVTSAFVRDATEALGCRVKRTYGSTEAPSVATSTAADAPERAAETDGRAVGDVEFQIRDRRTGRPATSGRAGELWLRGPELFLGYADITQTRSAVTRGWFRTADLATLDEDGWLTIVGRLADVIIRGGENVSAGEVEAVLEAHPAVGQAVVVGEPDEMLGERVAAFVVANSRFDVEACRAWFAERGMARFKTPERVVRLDAIPTLPAGKPDRAGLRARLAARE